MDHQQQSSKTNTADNINTTKDYQLDYSNRHPKKQRHESSS
ncbi:6012_t:CDS:1, partial [Racocetra persica]